MQATNINRISDDDYRQVVQSIKETTNAIPEDIRQGNVHSLIKLKESLLGQIDKLIIAKVLTPD